MSTETEKAKQRAQRRQHRKDHYTDADRALNGGGKKARRAAKAQNFKDQGAESAADFDFNQHGKGHIGGQELKHLRESGASKKDIIAAVKADGGELGKRAKNRIARWESKMGQKPPTNESGNEAVNPQQPANEMTQNTEITNTQEQTVNQDNDQSSVINGNNNTVDQNQDNSVDQAGSNNKSAISQSSADGDQMDHAAVMPSMYASANADAEANKLKNSYIDTIRPGTTSEMDTAIKNTQKQNINQDNDQSSTITGDNNTVWQQQDNSIRQYGGDNRSFVYQGGNSGVDTPVSAMTMSGFLDVDDSPAAQAKFHDLHSTLNNDAQKRFAGTGFKIAEMAKGLGAGQPFDMAALEAQIQQSSQNSYDRAEVAYNDTFGDRDAYRGTLSEYKFGAEPKAVDYDDDEDDDD